MKREWSLRTIYLYLVSFVTLMMIIVGSVGLIQSAVAFVYPPPVYYLGPTGVPSPEDPSTKITEDQVRLDRERQEQQIRYDRAREVARGLALLIVALPIYLYHWRKIQRERVDHGNNHSGAGT